MKDTAVELSNRKLLKSFIDKFNPGVKTKIKKTIFGFKTYLLKDDLIKSISFYSKEDLIIVEKKDRNFVGGKHEIKSSFQDWKLYRNGNVCTIKPMTNY